MLRHTGSLDFHQGTCASTSYSLCYLSPSLQRTQSSVKLLSLQNWQNRESFMQHLRTLVPGHLSSHSAQSSYALFASLALWQFSVPVRPMVQALESCSASGTSWSSAINPSLKGSGNNNSKTKNTDAPLRNKGS